MLSKTDFPSLPIAPTFKEMAIIVRHFNGLLNSFRLSDINFLTYAYALLKVIRSNALFLLDQPPAPWSWDPQINGLLTLHNFVDKVIENVQVIHRLLFLGAIQSASLTLEQPLLNQLEITVQRLELSILELDGFLVDAVLKLENQEPFFRTCNQILERSNGKITNND